MKESEIQKTILLYLKARGILHWRCSLGGVRLAAGKVGRNPMKGFPDIAGLYCKKFFTIEVKTKTGKLSEEQKAWVDRLQGQGVTCVIARSLDDVIEAMRAIEEVSENEIRHRTKEKDIPS